MFDKRLFSLVDSCWLYIGGIVFFRWLGLLASIAIMAFIAQALTWVAFVISTGIGMVYDPSAITQFFLNLCVLVILRAVSIYTSQRIADDFSFKAKSTIRLKLYEKLLELGPSFEESVSVSEALASSVEGATQLEVYFGGYLPQFIFAFLAPLTLFVCLLWVAWVPALILMLLVPLIPISIVFIQKPARKAAKAYWAHYVDLGGSFLEAIEGLTTLKIFEADERWHQKMNEQAENFRITTMNMLKVQLSSIAIMDLFAYGGAAVGIVVALFQYATGALDFFSCFMIIFLSQEFFLPLRTLGSLFHAGMAGVAASKRMHAMLDEEPKSTGTQVLENKPLPLAVSNCKYDYTDRTALHETSLDFGSTGFVALVGESGSGKSTLAGILAGRKKSYTGSVTLDGIEYTDIDAKSLMNQVTFVSGDARLFAGTVRDNLLLANPSASTEELEEALKQACMFDFVTKVGGLDFVIKENASNISGGQIQRLCIARALLHKTPVYIFDEATSSIDVSNEEYIFSLIRELAKNNLVIVVAHRLATIKDADRICVLDKGVVKQTGTHDELVAGEGVYQTLWNAQDELVRFASTKTKVNVSVEDFDEADEILKLPEVDGDLEETDKSQVSVSGLRVLWRLFALVKPLFPYLGLASLLGVIGNVAAVLMLTFAAVSLVTMFSFGLNLVLIGAIIAMGVVRGPARYAEQLLNHDIAFRLLAHIRDQIFSALRKLAPAKLEGKGKGDVVSLATSDVELLEVFYAHTISPVIIAFVCALLMLGGALWVSPKLALACLLGYVVVGIVLPLLLSRGMTRVGALVRAETGEINSFMLEHLRGLSEIIQFTGQSKAYGDLEQKTKDCGVSEDVLRMRIALSEALLSLVISLVSIAVIAYGFYEVMPTVGYIPVFVVAMTYFSSFGPLVAVVRLGASLQQTIGSGARVLALLDEKPVVEDVVDGSDVLFSEGTFSDVSFAYGENQETVLDEVSLVLPAEKMVCIAGKSGSGKSTLLKLLMRFWNPSSGEIAISQTNLNNINTACLRSLEGYMTQNTMVFEGSILDNLLVVNPNATQAQIRGALQSAALDDFVAQLPDGLNTRVGDLGSVLSGGEKQRLGLARIFLHNASLILLDEPTANLDALNEAKVMKALDEMRTGRTVVLVSHRPSTAGFADEFYTFENKKLVK